MVFLLRPSWSGGSILVSHLCLAPWWEAFPCGLPESMLGKSSGETGQLGNPHRMSYTISIQEQDTVCPQSRVRTKSTLRESVVALIMLYSPNPRWTQCCTLQGLDCLHSAATRLPALSFSETVADKTCPLAALVSLFPEAKVFNNRKL